MWFYLYPCVLCVGAGGLPTVGVDTLIGQLRAAISADACRWRRAPTSCLSVRHPPPGLQPAALSTRSYLQDKTRTQPSSPLRY